MSVEEGEVIDREGELEDGTVSGVVGGSGGFGWERGLGGEVGASEEEGLIDMRWRAARARASIVVPGVMGEASGGRDSFVRSRLGGEPENWISPVGVRIVEPAAKVLEWG